MKSFHFAVGFFVIFAVAYCVPMYIDWLGLKFYFLSAELRFVKPSPEPVRIKFVTVALAAACVAAATGWLFMFIPRRVTWLVHVIGLLAIVAASVAMISRESKYFG